MASGKIDVFAFIGTHKGAADLKKLHPRPHRLRAALGLDAKNRASSCRRSISTMPWRRR